MNKTFLIAMREYIENLRTKTFWLGILSVPILLVGTIVIMRIMSEAKDARPYGVVDYSQDQWLSKAIEDRGNESDFERALQELTELQDLSAGKDEVLATLEQRRDALRGTPIQQEFFDLMIDTIRRAEATAEFDRDTVQRTIIEWITSKTKEEIADLDSNFESEKYVRTDLEGTPAQTEAELKQRLRDEKIFAYFVIGKDPVASNADCRYISNNLTDNDLRKWFERHATAVVREKRIADLQLSQEQADSIREDFSFEAQKVSEAGEVEEVASEDKAHQFAPVVFVYLLWLSIMMVTQMLLTNTVEEKSNRIIEVLLSSVSPLQLMAGKVFGIAATGLTLVLFWALCAIGGAELLPYFVEGAASFRLDMIVGDPRYLGSFVAYFLGGYFFFAAILVGLGAVCNSLKEAQNLQQPVFIVLIVPIVAMVPVVNDPNGTLARALTYFPPFTPFLMMNRAGGPPPMWEYFATTALILVSILIAFWGAAKVFRIGILMTGKPPNLREVWGWLRAPVGAVPLRKADGEAP